MFICIRQKRTTRKDHISWQRFYFIAFVSVLEKQWVSVLKNPIKQLLIAEILSRDVKDI